MLDTTSLVLSCILGALALTVLWQRMHGQKHLPPGPPRSFIIGNLKDVPKGGNEWLAYERMAKACGSDIVYLNVLGSHIVVINSFEAARDLLDRKGVLYSSRPRLVMIKELRGWDWNLVLMSYGKKFVAHRRVVQQEFQPNVVADLYRPVMIREVTALLERLFDSPDDLIKHLKQMAGAIIMMVTYGHQVTSANDKFVALAEAVREHGERTPASNIVDIFPILKYWPGWLPGGSFQYAAKYARQLSTNMRSAPYEMVRDQIASGKAVPSIVSRLIQSDLATDGTDKEEFIENCSGIVYSAGADTTVAALSNFFLAMVMYPHVQQRAQEELDKVVGRDRMPTFEDRAQLPYVDNVVKETLRWKAVSPLGVPHATTDSDVYRGMYIPKGTTVIANIHAILHDPAVYKDPHAFNPDRFAPGADGAAGEPDPSRAAFGFGRRICPGRFFADDSVWLTVASALHALALARPRGAAYDGVRWSSGLVSLPSAYPCAVAPRFAAARELVRAAAYGAA